MTEHFDIAIIGGGIHGAGVAQAAAAAGYTVCVLEQFDGLARGTSGRSSKLIHGGLRYLETFQLALVRECLVERALLLKNASHLAQLKPFYIPIYRNNRRGGLRVRAGLALYAVLGGLRHECRFAAVARREWANLDGLETRNLQAVFRYQDAQTDDVALTEAVMRSAQALGCRLLTGAQVTQIELGKQDAEVIYQRSDGEQSINARVAVNAGGPWIGEILSRVRPTQAVVPMTLVQGAHLVVPGELIRGIYYAEAPQDGRPVLFMPWHNNTLVGTTETPYACDPANVAPLPKEIDYLLGALAIIFPTRAIKREQIIDAFAGLRVLPADRKTLNARPRETRLVTDRPRTPRLISIYGGKLTAYRATAEHALNLARASLPPAKRRADPRATPLSLA
jgi:glycerol-3-phosphate dehydrogenase